MAPEDDRERERDEVERPRIRVNDRRLFDREGNLRAEVEPQEASGSAPSTEPIPDSGPRDPSSATAETASRGRGPTGVQAPGDPGRSENRFAASGPGPGERANQPRGKQPASPRDLPRDFPAFIESQYYEALLFLGAIPHPQTGEPIEDLEMAKYKIDLLSMLQEKTEGNRSPEESKLLDDILYQLRMLYLQKTKVVKL